MIHVNIINELWNLVTRVLHCILVHRAIIMLYSNIFAVP